MLTTSSKVIIILNLCKCLQSNLLKINKNHKVKLEKIRKIINATLNNMYKTTMAFQATNTYFSTCINANFEFYF